MKTEVSQGDQFVKKPLLIRVSLSLSFEQILPALCVLIYHTDINVSTPDSSFCYRISGVVYK